MTISEWDGETGNDAIHSPQGIELALFPHPLQAAGAHRPGAGTSLLARCEKQRVRAEQTIRERLGYSEEQARETIKKLFVNLGITVLEMLYLPALNRDNIRGLVTFDHPEILWEALQEKKGVVLLACHMDNWEWLGAALALNGFPMSAVENRSRTVSIPTL